MASGRIALFVPLDALCFLRKQPIVLTGSPSLCLNLAPCSGASWDLWPEWGHPCPYFLGSQFTAVGKAAPAPSNAHQHSKDRSGLLSHRTAPVWEWGWVTKIWDADGRVRLDRFSGSPFHAISALWCQSASMQLTGVHITVGLASSSSKQT